MTRVCGRGQANFKTWNDALQTKNAQTVANLYVSDSLSFLPTVSPDHIKAGGAASNTEDYFIEFVKKNPFGTITDDSVEVHLYIFMHTLTPRHAQATNTHRHTQT